LAKSSDLSEKKSSDVDQKKSSSSKKGKKKAQKQTADETMDASCSPNAEGGDQPQASTSATNKLAGEEKKPKKEYPDFSDKNVDYNLYHEDPCTLIQKRVKISNDVVMSCKMITVNQSQANRFEYAAVVFARKGKTDKAFEYNLPLNLAPRIIAALNLMMKDNPRFFDKLQTNII
jgi:hypothetical protein